MIVLASASLRREALLSAAGLEFVIEPAGVPEDFAEELDPRDAALELAERKARFVAARHGPEAWVVGADTIVALDADTPGGWRSLGKPADEQEAAEMLQALSASRHRVITGVSVVRGGAGEAPLSACATTWVSMRVIQPGEVRAYVASGEWRGKAGGYAIQENADAFVTRLEGEGFDNVVGLPVGLTLELLRRAGAEPVAGGRDAR